METNTPAQGSPAQVTEAHRDLACTLTGRHYSISEAAELIADSEARAILEMASRLQAAFHEPLIKERDQLRAKVERLNKELNRCWAIGPVWNGESIGAALERTVLELRTRAERAEAEVERLTTNCTQLQESYRYHEARAERAEADAQRLSAELAEVRQAHAKERARLGTLHKAVKEYVRCSVLDDQMSMTECEAASEALDASMKETTK